MVTDTPGKAAACEGILRQGRYGLPRGTSLVYEALESDGAPADVLIRAAEKASLLVIGCWGRGGLRKPIGSIAEKVLMRLPCPTIITRPASGHAS
ncbi:universal stress protein [Arthrobacter sp. 4R501]|uniref:universal stress protein n=1 Tax=Arthrobacter sp. 4R501 TaxID=2058886 RepID=UPI0011B0A06C